MTKLYGIIYLIVNTVNNKKYVGQTMYSLRYRFKQHCLAAYRNDGLDTLLRRAIRKYGSHNFTYLTLQECYSEQELDAAEVYWITHYQSFKVRGYNMTLGGEHGYRKPFLTEADILKDMDAFYRLHGRWPTSRSRKPVPGKPDESWLGYENALYWAKRGLPQRSSLTRLLHDSGRRKNPLTPLNVTEDDVWSMIQEHHNKTGKWPSAWIEDEVPGGIFTSWNHVNDTLESGRLGFKSSLSKLKGARGVLNRRGKSRLSKKVIVRIAKKYFESNGKWPSALSGSIPELPGHTWKSVDLSLRFGYYSLPGGDTLSQLLAAKGALNNSKKRLTEKAVIQSIRSHYRRTGRRPSRRLTSTIPELPGYTWGAVDKNLQKGNSGLPGGSSLFQMTRQALPQFNINLHSTRSMKAA